MGKKTIILGWQTNLGFYFILFYFIYLLFIPLASNMASITLI